MNIGRSERECPVLTNQFAIPFVAVLCSLAISFCANAEPRFNSVVADVVKDVYVPVDVSQMHIESGILAGRMKINLEERLLKVDEKALTEGFVHRPGSHPWIGEHAGKFLHAAAWTYRYTHDERLKTLMDRIANTLMDAQTPDGYLGTYSDDKRWTSWDVWSHKYDLIGLLAWYDVTHDERALNCSKKIGDLLCATFGDDSPNKRDLSDSGTQDGMAPTSVLEPMCYLYRHTGEKKYLDFCYYITRNIEKHSKIISSLNAGKRVDQTSNAKAYEMLSNLVGLVELYRLTGEEKFLTASSNAWESIVKDHLYLSGTTSAFEHFRAPDVLPGGNPDNVGEGCVTVTWEQLNLSLLQLTGEAKYADQLERTIYNALLAAQNAKNGDICYFTPLVGLKPYTHEICCCLSSEPRGIALIPTAAYAVNKKAIVVNLYAAGSATFSIMGADQQPLTVNLKSETDFPRSGGVKLTFSASRAVAFDVLLRQPSWVASGANTYRRVTVDPKGSSEIEVDFDLTPRIVPGGLSYPTCVALERGPQLLALDPALNPNLTIPTSATIDDASHVQVADDHFVFSGFCSLADGAHHQISITKASIVLVPYSDAVNPIVWMPTKEHLVQGELPVTYEGIESQSRPRIFPPWMPHEGPLSDFRSDTYRTTYSRRKADFDWYSVQLKQPSSISRVVFTQGPLFPDGGWFDTSKSKPQIQVKRAGSGEWQTIATLDSYPQTTSQDHKALEQGQTFEVKFPATDGVTAIRILGAPSAGQSPKMSCTNCAELAAYGD